MKPFLSEIIMTTDADVGKAAHQLMMIRAQMEFIMAQQLAFIIAKCFEQHTDLQSFVVDVDIFQGDVEANIQAKNRKGDCFSRQEWWEGEEEFPEMWRFVEDLHFEFEHLAIPMALKLSGRKLSFSRKDTFEEQLFESMQCILKEDEFAVWESGYLNKELSTLTSDGRERLKVKGL